MGAIKNAFIAKMVYPDWGCRFYVGKSVPKEIVYVLDSLDNVEIVQMDEDGDWTGMFWRFLPASDESVDIFISRDCDSRLSYREKVCVDKWLESDKNFHSIRDHQAHDIPIMGGMWGCRNGIVKNMSSLIDNFTKGNFWQVDQNFLTSQIYPRVYKDMICHDDFHRTRYPFSFPIPHDKTKETEDEFIGKPYEFDDVSGHDGKSWKFESIYK